MLYRTLIKVASSETGSVSYREHERLVNTPDTKRFRLGEPAARMPHARWADTDGAILEVQR